MANFKTHRDFSLFISFSLGLFFLYLGVINIIEVFLLMILGILSSFLPDLDHSESVPNKALFNLLSFLVSLVVSVLIYGQYEFELFIAIVFFSFLFVRYGLKYLYDKFVEHRGMFHSIPTALLFSITTIDILFIYSSLRGDLILVVGFFIFIGYVSHLLLDEIYSVNIFGLNVKDSFGSALKIFSIKHFGSTLIVYILLLVSIYFLPEFNYIKDIILNIINQI